jgi:hypothetical protein
VTTSVYVQAVGFIDQTCIDMAADDSGGELDPAGADGVSLSYEHLLLVFDIRSIIA